MLVGFGFYRRQPGICLLRCIVVIVTHTPYIESSVD